MSFKNYIKNRFDNLETHLEKFAESGSIDALHDLRVELKKIRAVARFLRPHLNKKQRRDVLEPLRHYFLNAGEVRESQLLGQYLLDNELNDIHKDLKTVKTIKKRETSLQKETVKFLKQIATIEKTFLEETVIENKKLIRKYIESAERKLESELKEIPHKNEWHEVRKLAKRVVYGNDWEEIIEPRKLAYYDKLQSTIGNWHDDEIYHLLINVLKRNYKGNEKHLAQLAEAEARLQEKKKIKEEEIERLLGAKAVHVVPA